MSAHSNRISPREHCTKRERSPRKTPGSLFTGTQVHISDRFTINHSSGLLRSQDSDHRQKLTEAAAPATPQNTGGVGALGALIGVRGAIKSFSGATSKGASSGCCSITSAAPTQGHGKSS